MNKTIYAFLSIDFNLFLLEIQSEVIEIFSDLFYLLIFKQKKLQLRYLYIVHMKCSEEGKLVMSCKVEIFFVNIKTEESLTKVESSL